MNGFHNGAWISYILYGVIILMSAVLVTVTIIRRRQNKGQDPVSEEPSGSFIERYFTLSNIIYVAAAGLAVVSVLFIFAPALTVEIEYEKLSISGVDLYFSIDDGKLFTGVAGPSVFIFIFAAIISLIAAVFRKKYSTYASIIAAMFMLVSAVLFFVVHVTYVPQYDFKEYLEYYYGTVQLGWGAVMSGICCLLSACLCVTPAIAHKLNIF